jgi:hypothetical protein
MTPTNNRGVKCGAFYRRLKLINEISWLSDMLAESGIPTQKITLDSASQILARSNVPLRTPDSTLRPN